MIFVDLLIFMLVIFCEQVVDSRFVSRFYGLRFMKVPHDKGGVKSRQEMSWRLQREFQGDPRFIFFLSLIIV